MDLLDASRYASGEIIACRYQLESPIGEGGMGSVWRARDLATGAAVAVKLARADGDADETAARMQIEARIQAQLAHPDIVRAFDFGRTTCGDAFLVLELLEGCSLGCLLAERGRLQAVDAVRMLLPIAEALCLVHGSGIVHRDVKPDNIFIAFGSSLSRPKLLDFGIAHWIDAAVGADEPCGTVAGSPGYMAPEQAQGLRDVDHRADVWGLCMVLHEAIAGRAALAGPDDVTRKRGPTFAPSRSSSEDLGGSTALGAIIERGLAHDRNRRFQSMRELATALAEWLLAQGCSDVEADGSGGDWTHVDRRLGSRTTRRPRRSAAVTREDRDGPVPLCQ